jgi:hypothetical protein
VKGDRRGEHHQCLWPLPFPDIPDPPLPRCQRTPLVLARCAVQKGYVRSYCGLVPVTGYGESTLMRRRDYAPATGYGAEKTLHTLS